MVVDQDLAVVLLDLRRRLKDEYGDTPAVMMQIDRAMVAYRDFLRIIEVAGCHHYAVLEQLARLDGLLAKALAVSAGLDRS